jgi:hypothetical protein
VKLPDAVPEIPNQIIDPRQTPYVVAQLFPAKRRSELDARSPLCLTSGNAVGRERIRASLHVKSPFVLHLTLESSSATSAVVKDRRRRSRDMNLRVLNRLS